VMGQSPIIWMGFFAVGSADRRRPDAERRAKKAGRWAFSTAS
jgi:hypothetical protein